MPMPGSRSGGSTRGILRGCLTVISDRVSRFFRTVSMFLMDMLTVVIVPTILKEPLSSVLPLRSISAVILREWCLGPVIAAVLGFLMYRTLKSATSKWVWTIFALLFAVVAIVYLSEHGPQSVLWEHTSFWSWFSGSACVARKAGCRAFFAFTVPLIRSLSYSAAALFASWIFKPAPVSPRPEQSSNSADEYLKTA